MNFLTSKNFFPILILFFSLNIMAQDERAQLPLALRNAYFGVSIGSINYDFGATQFINLIVWL